MKNIFILLICFLTFYNSHSQSIDKNLIANYKFDNNINDASDNKNDGFIIGNVKPTQNRFNIDCSAYEFDGQTGYILINHNKALETISDKFTITAWAKLSAQSKRYWFTICCKSDQAYEDMDSPHFRFQLTKKTASLNSDFTCEWSQNFQLDTWYFFALTVNNKSIRYYINGVLALDTIYNKPLQPNKYGLTIGRDRPGDDEFFHGAIDDFRIYNKTLSDIEINSIYIDKTDSAIKSPCAVDSLRLRDTINITDFSDLPQEIDGVKINYQKIVIVNSPKLKLIPYDDAYEDNDTVSININGTWVRERYGIKEKRNIDKKNDPPINCNLLFTNNFLISKAWNLGSTPPNTLALDIDDGINPIQKVKIHSQIGLSGGIKIIYKPKK